MNKTLSTTLIVLAVLILAGGIFFAGNMYARANAYGPGGMMGNYDANNNSVYGPGGMMGGNGGMMGNYGGNNNNTYGPGGMMGGNGGMMGMMGGNGSMMSGYGYNNATPTPLTVDQAKAAAEKYLANLDNSDLQIAEVMIFDNNAYIVVEEASTAHGAFELLVDPVSQIAYPEHGPNMMWNLKYGGLNHQSMMGNGGMMGMMNGWDYQTTPADVSAELTVTPEQAVEYAQKYLDQYQPGTTAIADLAQFYGYYTLDFEKDGQVIGMLSVNGYSGQVFVHTWHGTFIEEAE